MNRFIKVLSALCAAVIILTGASACSSNKYALTIGDKKISAEKYEATAVSIKSQFFTSNDLEETDEIWTQFIDESYSATVQQYLDSMVQSYIISYTLYSIHFDELGLQLDKDVTDKIENTMNEYVSQAGSKEKLEQSLALQGYTYDDLKEQYYNEAKKTAVIMHYFGPDSKENPVSQQDLKLYYDEYYTKVKHIFLSTKDDADNDLSKPEQQKIADKADNIYKKALNGEDFDKLIDEYGEDPGMTTSPDGYIFSKDDTSYTRMFHNAAFDMEIGEIRLVQTNLGFHIMQRYSFTDGEIDKDTLVTLIENMMSEESADLLDDLKERIGVKYNDSLLEKLSVVNIKTLDTESESQSQYPSIDEIKDQLNIEDEE